MSEAMYLHKFRSLFGEARARSKDILENDRLYFANANDFNDPFDCLPRLSLEADDDQILGYLQRITSRNRPELSQAQVERVARGIVANEASGPRSKNAPRVMTAIFEALKAKLGVLSLSARADHVLLWSHYAGSHRGICLRYLGGDFAEFFGEAQPVVYSHARPSLNLFTQTLDEQITNALMSKADFWSYEEEWRIFDFQRGPGLRSYPPEMLDSVILGVAISPADEAEVRDWVAKRRSPVPILKASIDPVSFGIVIQGE